MNNWNQFLSAEGARVGQTDPAQVQDFGRVLSAAELAQGFVCVITDLGLIAATGADAASFLHNQLSNDVEHLGQTDVRLAAYCTPKGRMLASFQMWRDAETIFLQLPREIQGTLQKRLQMFIMRAKAKLSDAGDMPNVQVSLGLGGSKAEALLRAQFGSLPATPYSRIDHALGMLLRVGDAFGAPRYQWLTSADTAMAVWPALSAALAPGGTDAWNLACIHAGVPQVTLATQEQFVPQMVNFELLGGVNFKKGCYPGQEIVARSQYLGKLKRRTALASIDVAAALVGSEVFAVSDPDQPCGMLVNVANNGLGGVDALVEIKLSALEQGDIRLGSAGGVALVFHSMPYALDALEL